MKVKLVRGRILIGNKLFMMEIPSHNNQDILVYENFQKNFLISIFRLIKTETGRAILRVISGPRAFKVVLFARLTPIPFGLQNTIFGVS